MLLEDVTVAELVTKIFPVVTDEAEAPYLFYDEEIEHEPVKNGSGIDKASVDISVIATSFEECTALCEAVRGALDRKWAVGDGLKVDCITMTHASKVTWEGDAWRRVLTFGMRVSPTS